MNGTLVKSYLHHTLFKDSPARRADYIAVTANEVFPKKFCAHRWFDNSPAINRFIKVLPHLRKYVTTITKEPSCDSFATVKEACCDKLLEAKLEFTKVTSLELEPFLTSFQTAKPMAPFLFEDMHNILYKLMSRIVKSSVINGANSCSKLFAINVKEVSSSLKLPKDIDVGFGARKALKQSKASEVKQLSLYNDCLKFLTGCISKLIERSPLKYSLVCGISCLDPSCILANPQQAEKRIQLTLEVLSDNGKITSVTADRAKDQFSSFLKGDSNKECLQAFSRDNGRLDGLYASLIGTKADFKELWSVAKIIFIQSHGNATVESGFSVNEDILIENLKEESLVAQRIVYDCNKGWWCYKCGYQQKDDTECTLCSK